MSPLATALGQRAFRARPAVGTAYAPAPATTLADLRRGQHGRIAGYGEADPRITRRLFDLGLAPGAEVEVVRIAPLQDPVIFRVADYEIALRKSEARSIHVDLT